MNTDQAEDVRAAHGPHTNAVTISVNFKPVVMPSRRATGLEIKQAAISQGVPIKPDFVLFRELGEGRRERVPDDKTIELHHGEKFEAVPGDDNS